MRLSIMMFLASSLAACGGKKDEGPSCEQVTNHILEVTKQNLPGHENTNIANQKKAMVDQCEKKQMPAEVRTCIMGAKTISEISKCRGRGASNVQERPRRPRGSGAGSAGTGGSAGGTAGSATPPPSTGSGSASGSGSGSGSAK